MADLDPCPRCGATLNGWDCPSCGAELEMAGEKLVVRERPSRSFDRDRSCIGCGRQMTGRSELTAAWEDGDNSDAYITCEHGGQQTIF